MTSDIIELSEEVLILDTVPLAQRRSTQIPLRETQINPDLLKIEAENLQKQLGGTIKIGKILSQINADPASRDADQHRYATQIHADLTQINAEIFLKELIKEKNKIEQKIFFGFSLYKLDESINLKNILPQIKKIAIEIKNKLKERGISSRWVSSHEKALSSVIVQKNKLLTQGAEFCLFIKTQINADQDTDQRRYNICVNQRPAKRDQCESAYIGRTLSCQKFEEYEFYDFARPAREIEKGMLPPKLAQIMINLSQASLNGTILDPFCGSGTILQAALLLGYQNVLGTDLSIKAIMNTKKNLEWLGEKLKIKNLMQNLKIFQCDVQKLSEKISQNSIEAIVTEPYLGPIKKSDIKNQISKIITELSNLYLAAFKEFEKILKTNGRIVIIFPVFQIDKKRYFLPILDDLKKNWQIINPIPEELRKNPVIKLTSRNSIIYSRPKQKVLREIFIFKKYENK
jgi:tRNA G10  N-methylase Trm11